MNQSFAVVPQIRSVARAMTHSPVVVPPTAARAANEWGRLFHDIHSACAEKF